MIDDYYIVCLALKTILHLKVVQRQEDDTLLVFELQGHTTHSREDQLCREHHEYYYRKMYQSDVNRNRDIHTAMKHAQQRLLQRFKGQLAESYQIRDNAAKNAKETVVDIEKLKGTMQCPPNENSPTEPVSS